MTLIDSNARIFGRVNIIDAIAAAIVVTAVPFALAGLRSLRTSATEIQSVTPATVTAGEPARVRLAGAGLRPYLQAYITPAGTPVVVQQTDKMSQKATYLLSSALAADLELPALAAGTYDVYLFDQGRQIASKSGAVTAASPRPQASRQAKLRFYLAPETASLIKAGDRDEHGAAVTDVRQTSERSEVMEMHLADRENVWTGQRSVGQLVEVTLDVPLAESGPDRWTYNGEPLLAGNLFLLTTDRYRLHGVVTWIGDLQKKTPQ